MRPHIMILLPSVAGALVACADEPPVETVAMPVGTTPTVLLANQNGFYAPDASCGTVSGQVASIGGSIFLQQECDPDEEACGWGTESLNVFLEQTRADVECRLSRFLKNHALEFEAEPRPGGCIDATTDQVDTDCPESSTTGQPECWGAPDLARTIIMDIEQPHPKDLAANFMPWQRSQIVAAYKVRIDAANLAFPAAKLGLYGTLVPDGRGEETSEYEERRLALKAAGNQGLYDNLDYLVPVLYPRFGCDQGIMPGVACSPDYALPPRPWCDAAFSDLVAYTRQGIDGSRTLDGPLDMPLLPLLTVRVHNGNSCFGNESLGRMLLLDMHGTDPFGASLGVQLHELAQRGVTEAVLWMQEDDLEVFASPNTGGWSVTDYTDHLCAN